MEYEKVGILLTENCNASCRMCCDSRGIVSGKTVFEQELDLILERIRAVDSISTIGITGGEPLLYPELVEHILNYDFGRHMSFTIKTNGFWGRNINKCESFISQNHRKLADISMSYDSFHREFIPVRCFQNIIMTAKNYGVHTEVVGCFLKNGMKPGDILNELEETAYYTDFYYQPVIRTGRACELKEYEWITPLKTEETEIHCTGVLKPNLLINANLDVYPCCSQVIENTILKFGNLHSQTLNEIIELIKYNKIMFMIFTKGFRPFLDMMKKNKIKFPNKLTSPCEMCEYLFKSDWLLEDISQDGICTNL